MSDRLDVLALPGAGSSGRSWSLFASTVSACRVVPLPDFPTVQNMVDFVLERNPVTQETVLVGASLGAVVALEIARRTPVGGLVLIASGLGVKVSQEALASVEEIDPEGMRQLAHAGVAPHRQDLHEAREMDLGGREPGVLYRHLRALAAHHPEPLTDPPPTAVVWGRHDQSIGLGAHLRLAEACRGVLKPLTDAGHSAYLEAPDAVAECVEFVQLQTIRRRTR